MRSLLSLFLLLGISSTAVAINGWVFTPANQSSFAVWYENDKPTNKVVVITGSMQTHEEYVVARCKGELRKRFPNNWNRIPYSVNAEKNTCAYTDPSSNKTLVLNID